MRDQSNRLALLVESLRRKWGSRAASWGNELSPQRARLTTGVAPFDDTLGGLSRGRITELLGAPTSGMTTIALQLVARVQVQGELAVWFDLGHAFDAEYAAACGVDLDALLILQPTTAANALETLVAFVAQRAVGVIVVDQLAQLQSNAEHAHLLNRTLQGLISSLAESPTVLVALTVLPYPPDMVRALVYRGSLLAHAASLRLHVARAAWPDDPLRLGCHACVTILKDKIGGVEGEFTVALDFPLHEVLP